MAACRPWSVSSRGFKAEHHIGGIERDQRFSFQVPYEGCDADASDPCNRGQDQGEIAPGNSRAGHIGRCRDHEPNQVHHVHHNRTETGNAEKQPRLPFSRKEQDEERKKEMEGNQGKSDPLPAAMRPAEIPGNLLGKVASPDDQELREGHIGPEHDKRQQEFAQVVKRRGSCHLIHRPIDREHDGDHEHERQGRQCLSDNSIVP